MNRLVANMRWSWSSICGGQPANWSATIAARLRSDAITATTAPEGGSRGLLGGSQTNDPPGPGVTATSETGGGRAQEAAGQAAISGTTAQIQGEFLAAQFCDRPFG